MNTAHSLLTALTQALGADAVLSGNAIPDRYAHDWSPSEPVTPLAVLRPGSTAEVARALQLCSEAGVAVIPQGGLTGMVGAAVPSPGAVALSLERMNAIESVDVASATMTVQAGATLQQVQEAAAKHHFCFGVDLGARGSCQIGGMLATNAGGNGVVQFGMMREQALGLEVVLADSTVLPMLRPMLKNNTGYDLKQLFIGAEGTLGIVTRAVLRLHPLPRARVTAMVALPDYDGGLRLLRELQAAFPGAVAAFEVMWEEFFALSLSWLKRQTPFDSGQTHPPLAALIDVVGGQQAALEEAMQMALANAMECGAVTDAVLAQSSSQARNLWQIRETTGEFPVHLQPINFDVSLPILRIGHFVQTCREALSARWRTHRTVFFGHIGDGNLHLTVDARSLGPDVDEVEVESLIYRLLQAEDGSISAEHGIGLLKKQFLHLSRTSTELALMRALKNVLDPRGTLNPGKIF